jgi:hypothetical protein
MAISPACGATVTPLLQGQCGPGFPVETIVSRNLAFSLFEWNLGIRPQAPIGMLLPTKHVAWLGLLALIQTPRRWK